MELVIHTIARSQSDHRPVVIAPIGDIQWQGPKGPTAKDTLKRHIEAALAQDAFFLGMGDFCDWLSPSNRQRLAGAALYDCVTEDTRILTRSGWKYHHEVLIGEDVLGYDVMHRTAIWTPVRRIVVWDEAPVVDVQAEGWSWCVTDNHRWVVQMQDGRQEILPTYALRQGKQKIVTAASCQEDGDSDLSADEAALLGWILTDGHVKFPECWTTYISQVKPQYIGEIRAILSRLSWLKSAETQEPYSGAALLHSHKYGPTWTRWGFSAPEIRGLFARAGAAHDNDIPKIASHLSVVSRRAMLMAMLHAEGHQETGRHGGFGWAFTQKPGSRLDLFFSLCALLGIPARQGHDDGNGVIRTGTRNSPLRWVQGKHWARSTNEVRYARVWCPITDTGTWMAQHKFQTSFTGNSASDVIDDKAMELVHEVYDLFLRPTKGRWLGMLEGHHFHTLKTGETTDMRLCQLLGAPFLGTCAKINMRIHLGKPQHGNKCSIVLWAHHGVGSGQTPAAALNRLKQEATHHEGIDVFLTGHNTKSPVDRFPKLYTRWNGRGSPVELHRDVHLVSTGGFTLSRMQGAKQGNVPRGGYAEQRMLVPSSIGAPFILIFPKITESSASGVRRRATTAEIKVVV